jgi:hypothetical protein
MIKQKMPRERERERERGRKAFTFCIELKEADRGRI